MKKTVKIMTAPTRLLVLAVPSVFRILSAESFQVKSGRIQGHQKIEIFPSGNIGQEQISHWSLSEGIGIEKSVIHDDRIELFTSHTIPLQKHIYLTVPGRSPLFLVPEGILDLLYSEKALGFQIEGEQISMRVFAPRAKWVRMVLFSRYQDVTGREFPMIRDDQGIWEYHSTKDHIGKYYGYRVWGPSGEGEMFDSSLVVADPYSPFVATLNHYTHPGKTLIWQPEPFRWEGDSWLSIDWRDLIIYEMHVRDLTAHPSSGLADPGVQGTYAGLIDPSQRGGLPYIQSLGVNAIELLPVQDFGNLEVPFKDHNAPVYNTWNPYAANHWGYMTSYFFAPETYYGSGGNLTPGAYSSQTPVNEFKNMVKSFHQQGIAVLMDVVYNHVSQYDHNPLKYIDKFYYFRLNGDCSFTSVSGCGNDLKTERPMARRLIIDSVVHWMKEFHIDGFRFDLAKMIDWQTIDVIREAAQKVNPGVILIAEPWGGGYDPHGFSDHGWASWNDQIRNGVKGQNPVDGLGFIFGQWQGNNNHQSLRRYFMGSLRSFGGQYADASHSVNYLESHDDHTLGDFIRIGLKEVAPGKKISNIEKNTRLDNQQLRLHKLAALALFSAQGPVMIHEGQEYARSKVIASTYAPDPDTGKIDHNSYNKDNETNWLNYDLAALNSRLTDYYRGLIRLRKTHPAFCHSDPEDFHFFPQTDSLFFAFKIQSDDDNYLVLLNGNPGTGQPFTVPAGKWGVLADSSRVESQPWRWIKKRDLVIPASSGMILMQTLKMN